MTSCSVAGCSRNVHARTVCGTHYQRLRRIGSVDLISRSTPACLAPGCTSDAYSNGLCTTHYQRVRSHGRLELPAPPTLRERFDANHRVSPSGCWMWQMSSGGNGYGRLSVDGRLVYAHRIAWELHRGPIPAGLTIDHLCMVRLCVNPDHLEPVTLAENIRRAAAARRLNRTNQQQGRAA